MAGAPLTAFLVCVSAWRGPLLSRRAASLVLPATAFTSLRPSKAANDSVVDFTFTEKSLGLDLVQDGNVVRIDRIKYDSPAIAKGVAPQSAILRVNGESTTGLGVGSVQQMIKAARRPVTLRLDSSTFRALPPVEQTQAAASSLGMETARIQVQLLTGPQDPRCGLKTRASDVVEVEFSAMIADGMREFDSSEMRSGRPFAFMLGNGDRAPRLKIDPRKGAHPSSHSDLFGGLS